MKQLNTFIKCWFGTFIFQNLKSLICTHSSLIYNPKSLICRTPSSIIYNPKSKICTLPSIIYNLKSIIFFLLLLLSLSSVSAQQYPVQGTMAVMAPYPAYLSDYANGSIEKLVLNLTLTDINLSNKQVKLRLFIQSQNTIIAKSNNEIINEPTLILDGGVPQRFTSTELAVYFNLENLQGITQAAYSQPLPEGVYTFGFEVFDYFTGNKLSGRIQQLFWLTLSDPPLLNMPLNNENISNADPNNPQITFQWTPRGTQVSQTEYTFTLSELWDDEGNASQQFLAAIPKHQTTTNNTTLIYGISDPPLLVGRTYAWRVQAKAKVGLENVGLYRQEGYSNIFTFKYGGQCPMVENVKMEAKSYDRIYISWDPAPANNLLHTTPAYTVAARKYTSDDNWQWVEFQTPNTYYNLVNIEANTVYEIKVGNNCPSGTSTLISYTLPQRITTLENGQVAGIICGQVPAIDLTNQNLIDRLSVNDVVMAGDFVVVLISVSGDQNGWSGEAWTKVKWLGDTKIKLKYKGIKVNTDKRLVGAGYFETTYDPSGKNIGDVDKAIEDVKGIFTGGTDVGKVKTGADTTVHRVNFDIPDPCNECSFTANDKGGGTIHFGGDKKLPVDKLPTTIKDSNGDLYEAKADNSTPSKIKITKIGNAGGKGLLDLANKTTIDLNKGRVDFAPANGMIYAFDAWQAEYNKNNLWEKKYEKMGDYRVSAKAIAPGVTDKVMAKISGTGSLKTDEIKFINGKGTIYEKKKIDSNNYEITLVGGPAADAQEIYALYPQGANKPLTLGKLLVASYPEKNFSIILVPTKGNISFDKQKIAETLNAIYNPLNIKLQVSQADKYEDTSWDTAPAGLNVSGSNSLSVFTPEMKALNKAYSTSRTLDKRALYLFVFEQADDNTILGDMPRGRQFGYLFTKNNTHLEKTVAHELGHGIFRLKHTVAEDFGEMNLAGNVMNYPAGEKLSKYQWDIMHDPPFVLGVFENDEDAQEAIRDSAEKGIVNNQAGNYMTPDKRLVNLPAGAEIFYNCENENKFQNTGYLYKFRADNKIWKTVGTEHLGSGFQFEKYTSGGEQYTIGILAKEGDEVWQVTQTLVQNQRTLSIRKMKLSNTTAYGNIFEMSAGLSEEKSIPVTTKCDDNSNSNAATNTTTIPEPNSGGRYDVKVYSQNGKWQVQVTLKGKPHEKTSTQKAAIEAEMNKEIAEKLNELEGLNGKRSATVTAQSTEDSGEFWVKDMNGLEWLHTICDLGGSVWETAALPKKYWDKDEGYQNSTIHCPPTFAGASDGVVEEVTEYQQLIKLAYDVSTKPEVRQGLWNSVKNISLESIKNAAVNFYEERKEKYTSNKPYIVRHTVAKDAVAVVAIVLGLKAIKSILKNVEEGVKTTGKEIAEKGGELVGKYNWGTAKRYFQHIQAVTGRAVPQKQIDKLKEALRAKEYKKLSKEEYILYKKEYSPSRKEKMVKEWETNTGQTWPVDVNGRRYQLHHIIEQQYGGPNEWWNSHPAKFPNEHQGGIHAAGSPSRELFK